MTDQKVISLKNYLNVTKPGIILGNLFPITGGFFFGAAGSISLLIYFATLLGMTLVMAAGCVFNNVIDRDIDALMERTKLRELVTGRISPTAARSYALLLTLTGALVLFYFTNTITTLVSLFGLFFYVVIYSGYTKRHTVHGTEVGAFAGSIPPVVGYTAATNQLDLGALAVFLVLFFWQLPHSYAIAIKRLKDYKAARIPVLPIAKSMQATKRYMLFYTVLYTLATLLPTIFGYTGAVYLTIQLIAGLIWIYLSITGFFINVNTKTWARKIFVCSIIEIMVFSLVISLAASFHF